MMEKARQDGIARQDRAALGLDQQLLKECEAMARLAFSSGLPVSADTMSNLEELSASDEASSPERAGERLKRLSGIHRHLSTIVKPATPRTILLMEGEAVNGGIWRFLGPVPLIRRLILAAIFFLVAMVAVSLSPDVNGHVHWQNDQGWTLLLEELFLIVAAGLGATFSALFLANRFVVDGTFDPKYDATYWTRIVLGIVAGMILGMLIPINDEAGASSFKFAKPTLALLGGFSVTVVYRILNRMVTTVESLVRGDGKEIAMVEIQREKSIVESEQRMNQLEMASRLISLKDQIRVDPSPEILHRKINQILGDIIPMDTDEDEMD